MSRVLRIFLLILVVGTVLFLVSKFFNINFFKKTQVCPPEKCTYTVGENGKVGRAPILNEEGRVRKDFENAPPLGFPPKFPIDQKPLKVISSYIETVPATLEEDGYKQITYSYITSQSSTVISANFDKYLKTEGYDVSLYKENPKSTNFTISGIKKIDIISESITISVATQNQFENIVTISMIVSSITQNQ